jgi:antitoxin (DNA-binding transcriptional repressor) of toxin-antitoxin stability system
MLHVRQICLTMKTASVRELRSHFPRVFAWVKGGEEVAVTMRGKVVARIVPLRPAKRRAFKMPDIRARLRKSFGDTCYDAGDIRAGIVASRAELS